MGTDKAILADIGVCALLSAHIVGEDCHAKGNRGVGSNMNAFRVGLVELCTERDFGSWMYIHAPEAIPDQDLCANDH